MRGVFRKGTIVAATTLAFAAILGGSLGLATAGTRSSGLVAGQNVIGGPIKGDVAPAKFVSCLGNSWTALYIWDNRSAEQGGQRWQHYLKGVPDYVNSSATGGITVVPRLAGVYLFMSAAMSSPFLPDSNADTCP
ncbi:MAG: hypothetical protein DYG91_10000 [Chloroflexi bacterium CFX7]|nr:MAG: hypothetical protein EDM76_05975 [bacterium]MCE7928811.1 hypothetical protein [Chloroflexi bacterium CFX7]